MTTSENQTMSGQVKLDGNTFTNVEFKDATLIYSGGLPPTFNSCKFAGTTFSFEDQASLTVAFLNAMAPSTTNMREVVYGLIPALKD